MSHEREPAKYDTFPKLDELRHRFSIGDDVIWTHQPHGGYGYLIDVPAKVVGVTSKRVRVLAKLRDGGEKLVSVRPHNIRTK